MVYPQSNSSGNRGRWRGANSKRYPTSSFARDHKFRNSSTKSDDATTPDRDVMEGLSPTVMEIIQLPETASEEATPLKAKPKNVEYLGSYNWTNSAQPTIVVPGSPPIWTGDSSNVPFTLAPDGLRVVDQDFLRMGTAHFAPLFAALDHVGAQVDWPTVDIVTSRNALRKLMRWIGGTLKPEDEFRIDVDLAGESTILLNRWDKKVKEKSKWVTYGTNFEQATTKAGKDCESSTSHTRIVKYDFAGLRMIVGFDVDACLLDPQDEVEDLSNQLQNLGIDKAPKQPEPPQISPTFSKLSVISGGTEIPQDSLTELTTRSERSFASLPWAEVISQLHLTATPHVYIGVHRQGTILEIKKYDLEDELLAAKLRESAAGYEKLGHVLRVFQSLAIDYGKGAGLSFVCRNGMLTAYKRLDGTRALPETILVRFDSL